MKFATEITAEASGKKISKQKIFVNIVRCLGQEGGASSCLILAVS